MRRAVLSLLLIGAALSIRPAAAPFQAPAQADGVAQLLGAVQAALIVHRVPDFRLLTSPALDEGDRLAFGLTLFDPSNTNAAVRERDRQVLPNGVRLLVEILVDRGGSGEIATWQMTIAGAQPKISGLKQISSLAGLRRLELDTSRAFNGSTFKYTAKHFRM